MEFSKKLKNNLLKLNNFDGNKLKIIFDDVKGILFSKEGVLSNDEIVVSILGLLNESVSHNFKTSASHNVIVTELNFFLEDLGLSTEANKGLCDLYSDCESMLIKSLEETHSSFDEVVDLDWRIDYQVSSKNESGRGTTKAILGLQCLGSNGIKTFDFSCSKNDILDLLSQLRQIDANVAALSQQ